VKVEDSAGNVVASASTTITLIASGGTLAACTGLTATSGVVNVGDTAPSRGLVGTSYTLSASATGLTGATSTNFSPSTYGTATKLVFTTQPGLGRLGRGLDDPARGEGGGLGRQRRRERLDHDHPDRLGRHVGCLHRTNGHLGRGERGNCTFAGLVGTSYTLSASATGLTGATSTKLLALHYGTATKLVSPPSRPRAPRARCCRPSPW